MGEEKLPAVPGHLVTWLGEIVTAAGTELLNSVGWMLLGAFGFAAVTAAFLLPKEGGAWVERRAWASRVLVCVALGLGAWRAFDAACLLDDAYITFRYIENFLDGHGLVFNIGERVEGYTNFLWAMLIAGITWVTGAQIPHVGFYLAFACFLTNLVVIGLLAHELAPAHRRPLAVALALALIAAQEVFTDYGTTGLETASASLWVNLGLLHLVRLRSRLDAGLAGLFLILATLTRPDHSLFYALGSFVLVVQHGRAVLGALKAKTGVMEAGFGHWLAYAAPFVLYLAHLWWRISFYGDFFPNTYYAKSADLTYWSMGAVAALAFYLQSHAWVLVLAMFFWVVRLGATTGGQRRFRIFAPVIVVLYSLYVMRVGGDFMFGRFFVSLLPLMVLGATLCVVTLADRSVVRAAVAAFVVGATVGKLNLVHETWNKWWLADETWNYQLSSLHPLVGRHKSFRAGHQLRVLYDAGVRPTIATTGIGMVGFYGRLETIDTLGLTDRFVAHSPIPKRRRPGHEKKAPNSYLHERGVMFKRYGWSPYSNLTKIRLPNRAGDWHIMRYDVELMKKVSALLPKWRFVDFPAWLDKRIAQLQKDKDATGELDRKTRKKLARDLKFFRSYYFAHNDDPKRLKALEALLERAPKRPPPATEGDPAPEGEPAQPPP